MMLAVGARAMTGWGAYDFITTPSPKLDTYKSRWVRRAEHMPGIRYWFRDGSVNMDLIRWPYLNFPTDY